jgi:hypothetical protein
VVSRLRVFTIQHEVKRDAETIHVMEAGNRTKKEPSRWNQTNRQKNAADNL